MCQLLFLFHQYEQDVAQIEELAKIRKVSDYEQVDLILSTKKGMDKPVWRREWLETSYYWNI